MSSYEICAIIGFMPLIITVLVLIISNLKKTSN